MNDRLKDRSVRFFVEDNCLVRTVVGTDGRSYTHRCDLASFEAVAHAIEETPAQGNGTGLEELAAKEKLAFTRVNVALEFLKERGLVDVRHRRSYPATGSEYLDAMIEFHALRENPAPNGD